MMYKPKTQKQVKQWFLDSVPSVREFYKNHKLDSKEYVIATISGLEEDIIETHKQMSLVEGKKGNELVKNRTFIKSKLPILTDKIVKGKIEAYGTILWHSKTPEPYLSNPSNFKTLDTAFEQGYTGMRGRSYAQTVWEIMKNEVVDKGYPVYPVINLDQEQSPITKSTGTHFYRQMKQSQDKTPEDILNCNSAAIYGLCFAFS